MTGTWHSAASAVQRPYDIHSGNAVDSLVQLFSTMSVQYVPSWSKEMVALLRKVSPQPCAKGGGIWFPHRCLLPARLVARCPVAARAVRAQAASSAS